ncbi:hypothetical protein [Lewinella sp. W8]|uniref:hypothetical protein n=1 Tax=Lewinella sp. W8 TaxID=2528208 RepID=UPI0010679D6B|nr:hypothetical protein [Lewinella sp. W8]MTB53034.1 hypothetical protein [Lewinella sp. W8]
MTDAEAFKKLQVKPGHSLYRSKSKKDADGEPLYSVISDRVAARGLAEDWEKVNAPVEAPKTVKTAPKKTGTKKTAAKSQEPEPVEEVQEVEEEAEAPAAEETEEVQEEAKPAAKTTRGRAKKTAK